MNQQKLSGKSQTMPAAEKKENEIMDKYNQIIDMLDIN